MIGEIVGNYRIVAKLSVGGMGTVYKAQHTLIGKLAAVKVLHPELCTNHDIVNRFLKEAQATTTIKHPGIVDVIDFGYMASGHAFLVMEFLEGMSLARRLKTRGRMHEGEAAMLLRTVCVALAAAHAKGIVHRDLKPDNIFLVPDPESALGERPKILDFGIAKLTDVGIAGSTTKTGAVMGTPTYMSPEQCKGTGDVDHRADLYSLGCIYYELITGRPPFTNLGAGELIGTHIYVEPEPPSVHLAAISPETEALIMALLQKRPEKRPQTAKELGQRLSVIALQQSWITASSPSGITAQVLPDLVAKTEVGPGVASSPGATTPYGFTPAPHAGAGEPVAVTEPPSFGDLAGVAPVNKPTTLSGAASQSMSGRARRSRRGVGLAMLAAALVAGGTIAVVQVTGGSDPAVAPATQMTAPAVAPATPDRAVVTTPAPAPAPAATISQPEPATTTMPAPSPPPANSPPAAGVASAVGPAVGPAAAPVARPAATRPKPKAAKAPIKPAGPPKQPAPAPNADPKQPDPRKLIETELD